MIIKATGVPVKFGGGLNTMASAINIGDNESPNCKNVFTDLTGILERRLGATVIATADNGSWGNGLFDYVKDSTTHYLMAYINNYLYKMTILAGESVDTSFDSLTFGTPMSDDTMEFEQFNDAGTNYLIMATHNRDKLQKYDGTSVTDLSSDADMPLCKHIKVWMGFLFCANVSGYESRVYYNSTSGSIIDSSDWATTVYQDINTNDGDYITALAILKGRLYTFKRHSIHRWTYLGGEPLFSVKTAVSGVGTISSKSVVNISHPKYGEILVFLAPDSKFYGFDGTQVLPLSTKIELDNGISEFNLSRLNEDYLYRAVAVDYQQRHWYSCSVPTGSYNNWTVVWDYYTDSWWPMDGNRMNAAAIIQSARHKNYYFLSDDSKLYQYDKGITDGSTAVTSVYDTKKFEYGSLPLLKSQHYIDLQLKNVPGTTVTFQERSDWSSTWSAAESLVCNGGGFILGTSKLGDTVGGLLGGPEAVTKTVALPNINHTQQFKIGSTGSTAPWEVYAADIVGTPMGYGA